MYVVHLSSNREGEFEFNEETQNHTFETLGKARKFIKEIYEDHRHDYAPPLTLEESKEELGEATIYVLEKV